MIVGTGPAGLFCGYLLAKHGYRPILLERGKCVERRLKDVEKFWQEGILDPASNVQFGEGGAGTFSDGKLNTLVKDKFGRNKEVLRIFVEAGAPEQILYEAKPHIGTDILVSVVRNLREQIIAWGGEVRFGAHVTELLCEGAQIKGVVVTSQGASDVIESETIVLAVGHSARDTFEMISDKKIFIEPKPFSVGARIEHTQESVNRSLYGKQWNNPNLPQGEYQLSYRTNGRAVYTFCMCPGGVVVPAASERETVVTNGMSEFARNGANANSALVVSVSPDDFGKDPLDGVRFVRSIEKKAYSLALGSGKYFAPAATVGSFLNGGGSLKGASVVPTYAPGVVECNFEELFPKYVTDMMRIGLQNFSRKMKCFGDLNAVLTAPETRTSSPVRITRVESMESISIKGLYPCGEGAGYAGGIMSAAVDGVRCALKIIEK